MMSDAPETPDSFWEFSTRLYDQPGVKEACLDLQDRFNADVNLVLFCLWTVCDGETWEVAVSIAAAHQTQIMDLRAARMNQTRGTPAYDDALETELAAEHVEQDVLDAMAGGCMPPDAEEIAYQLRRYAAELGVDGNAFVAAAPIPPH